MRRATDSGSSEAANQNTTAITASTAAQIWATASQPQATITSGAMNFVTAAPTLPAPKIPSAVPCRSLGYQCDT